jgi:hypothetical protein
VSAANWVSWRSERIFCAALIVSLSNAASIVDDGGSRKFEFELSEKDEDGGLKR